MHDMLMEERELSKTVSSGKYSDTWRVKWVGKTDILQENTRWFTQLTKQCQETDLKIHYRDGQVSQTEETINI
jgi:hypothetical protein